MAISFLNNINLNKNEIQNFGFQKLASPPESPVEGQVYYDTGDDTAYMFNGTGWVDWETSFPDSIPPSVVNAKGDLIVGTSNNTVTNLSAGSNTQILSADDTEATGLKWIDPPSAPVTSVFTRTGAVVAEDNDYTWSQINKTVSDIADITTKDVSSLTGTIDDTMHGSRGGGNLHSDATGSVSGFMPSADKTKLDAAVSTATASTLVIRDGDARFRAGTPSHDDDVAIKSYVDAHSTGLDFKQSVRATTTANITLSGTQTIDGVPLSIGNRVLVKNQSTASQNGIYVVASGAWSRSDDADTTAKVNSGMFCFVEEGTSNANTGWVLSTPEPITLGDTSLEFVVFSTQGTVLAGNGLTKSGNTISAQGTANRISVGSGGIDIDSNYAGQSTITTVGTIASGVWQGTEIAVDQGGTGATSAAAARTNLGAVGKYATTIGNDSNTDFTVTHGLGTRDVTVTIRENGSPYQMVYADVEMTDNNNIKVMFSEAPDVDEYRVVVTG